MFGNIIRLLLGLVGLGNKVAEESHDSKERQAGADAVRVDAMKEAADARSRMDSVKPSSKSDTDDSLRKHKY